MIEPVARGQEARADRMAAIIAGGGAAALALVKVAVVQPLFREVLERYDPTDPDFPNLYAFFWTFWYRLPGRVGLGDEVAGPDQPARHARPRASPPLPDRLALIQAYAGPVCVNGDTQPATTFLGDLEIFEQMLHNRLFGL
ncbi:MAG: M48 family metallopeptidase, partial [Isosphaeraceae bacterium]